LKPSGDASLSRFEGKFEADAAARLDERDVLALLAAGPATELRRSRLIATCLSAEAGWRDAATVLGGAFAGGGRIDETGLTGGKE
jgi:hypothetical protein